MNIELLNKIKRLVVSALVSDDVLMGILVLKGGNALNLAYNISDRGSIDIDFSIEKDLSSKEIERIKNQVGYLLNTEFEKESLKVFDIKFYEKPNIIDASVRDFWGGYCLEFKIISLSNYNLYSGDQEKLRRNAIVTAPNNSTKFEVDISKYEFVSKKRQKDIEGAAVYVYTPEMLAIEKLRALCQQVPEYKSIINSMTPKSRARDFYDIYNLTQHFKIDFNSEENIELLKHIFGAKHVPIEFINKIKDQREFHRNTWSSVEDTVNQLEQLKPFDFYFNFVINRIENF